MEPGWSHRRHWTGPAGRPGSASGCEAGSEQCPAPTLSLCAVLLTTRAVVAAVAAVAGAKGLREGVRDTARAARAGGDTVARGHNPGGMRCPGVSLWGLLCLGVAVAGGRPVRLERVRGDARTLTRTLSTRLQQLQLFPLTLRVTGLEGVPEGGVPAGLGVAAQRLQLFQQLLGAVAGGDLRLAQVANDLENLRSLLGVLGALLGCPPPRDPPPAPPAPLAEAPHTVAGVALARLQGCLEGIAAHLEEVPAC